MRIVHGVLIPRGIKLSTEDKKLLEQRKLRKRPLTRAEKDAYMNSAEWRLMQRIWLARAGYRCQMFPWKKIGKTVNGKYRGYEIHHLHKKAYRRLGKERYKRDVVVLSTFAHQWVYHRILSLGKTTVQKQKKFPNLAQQIMNIWCILPYFVKWIWIIVSMVIFILILLQMSDLLHHRLLWYAQ
ncbi:MAG: hypothetical protein NZ455_08455 [Bacteroidia bacterium]|nr:hypothetical protein [Bacteroidia bacterium]MDW8345806.1 hypothetical protein [Bacteroidia bacterium]